MSRTLWNIPIETEDNDVFAKIFESIYDGSLRKNWKALITFQQLLVLCDEEGYVDKTPDAISARTTIPLDIIQEGLTELSAPDPESRSQEEEGRRIVLINPGRRWGWRIVNHSAYRQIRSKDELRAYWRNQKRDERSNKATPSLALNSDLTESNRNLTSPHPISAITGKNGTKDVTPCNAGVTQSNAAVTPPTAIHNYVALRSDYATASVPVPVPSSFTEKGGVGEREIQDRATAVSSVMNAGVDPAFAGYVYDDWASRGGADGSGVIVPFLAYAVKRWSRERSEWVRGTHRGNKKQKTNIFA